MIMCCNWLCVLQSPPDWQEILTYFRGSELQNYFTKILEDDLKVCVCVHTCVRASLYAGTRQ